MLLRYDRQKYRDVDPTEVDANRYPVTQLKFDGIWCGVEVHANRRLEYYSRNGRLVLESTTDADLPAGFYVGEYMYGSEWSTQENRSGKLYLFDVLEHKSVSLTNQPYGERYALLQSLRVADRLPTNWSVIANYPTLQVDSIWSNLVESKRFEGLVFRSLTDNYNVEVPRAKLTITVDLRVLDFEPGEGRLRNTLGVLICTDSEGRIHRVGGGLSDKLRKMIWAAKEFYRGKIFICECKKIFESGQLRHPNFVSWHPDKTTL